MSKFKPNSFHADLVKDAVFDGKWEIPRIESNVDEIPTNLVLFTEMRKTANTDQWVHFYTDDRRFEVVWTHPKKYLSILQRFKGIISPDFSLFLDMPLSMQVWNVYRNHAIAHWFTTNGIKVIPNVRWGDERSYEFCFDGIVPGGIVAVGSHGCMRDSLDRLYFERGFSEMCKRLIPHTILVYGPISDSIFLPYIEDGINIVRYPSEMEKIYGVQSDWEVA